MRLFSIIPALFFCGILSAQKDSTVHFPQNAIHAEGGGNAVYYSVNYSHLFYNVNKPAHAFRMGCGIVSQFDKPEYFIPFEFTWLFGKKTHFFEIGPGVVIHSGVEMYYLMGNGGYTFYSRDLGLMGSLRIGYCFIPLRKNNLSVRAAFTPLFASDNNSLDDLELRYKYTSLIFSGGISLGWAF